MAFNIGFYAYAITGHTRADQLLPQLLMGQFDTFPFAFTMYTLNICMKEFIIFVCTDSTEIFSKLRSAGLNYNMPSFFTDSYCAGGI